MAYFSEQEMTRRLDRLKRCMEEKAVDAVLVTSVHNTLYYSNFWMIPWGRLQGLVIPREGEPVLIAPRIEEDGADIIDIGAESSRPGHKKITLEEELARLIPALEAIVARVKLPISVDTSKAEVARRAVNSGAVIINDISGLKADPKLALAVANGGAGLILMHNQQRTQYHNLLPDIIESLQNSANTAVISGVPRDNIIIDPGIGFGKTPDHNLEVLARLNELRSLSYPILVGSSRKSTLGLLLNLYLIHISETTRRYAISYDDF